MPNIGFSCRERMIFGQQQALQKTEDEALRRALSGASHWEDAAARSRRGR
jgi:hypothetical protein